MFHLEANFSINCESSCYHLLKLKTHDPKLTLRCWLVGVLLAMLKITQRTIASLSRSPGHIRGISSMITYAVCGLALHSVKISDTEGNTEGRDEPENDAFRGLSLDILRPRVLSRKCSAIWAREEGRTSTTWLTFAVALRLRWRKVDFAPFNLSSSDVVLLAKDTGVIGSWFE